MSYITKTRLYSFDPLKPHFNTVKLGLTGVYIIFLISAQNIDCVYSLEMPQWGSSNKYPQSMFWAEIWKISEFLSENFQFLVVKFSIYLNRHIFVMELWKIHLIPIILFLRVILHVRIIICHKESLILMLVCPTSYIYLFWKSQVRNLTRLHRSKAPMKKSVEWYEKCLNYRCLQSTKYGLQFYLSHVDKFLVAKKEKIKEWRNSYLWVCIL